ncbi:MAG TPA: hypothetical protein VHW72_01255, partial [Candidatus Angelobacter sp.]|nr:hypothetical protein [Candidatus Angelobacter sp.]
MGQHDDDIFFPGAKNRFQLSEDQQAKILKGCKALVSRRPPPDDSGRDPVFLVPIFPPFLDGCANLSVFFGLDCVPGP